MTKRLKYTKDILTHMLNNNNKNTGGASSAGGTGSGPSRMATVTSAMSSKRSGLSNEFGET